MENIRQYLLSITAAAIICSLITSLMGKKGTYAAIVRMLCGLFMALTMISPLIQVRLSDFTSYFDSLQTEADTAAASGSAMAEEASEAIIKRETESYILDKALSMGLSIEVEVTLADAGVPYPCHVSLQGAASPYVRRQLQAWLEDNLGIPEENQTWT